MLKVLCHCDLEMEVVAIKYLVNNLAF
uniref:Uncharacterized protein n=1 Tax=Arundo donax TaxID=35708 RepID=A0A0A9GS77_ARUDO